MAIYHKTTPQGANRITPRPEDGGIPPILPPQPDNVAGSLSGNAKAQSLGENLWEGEAFAEQRALKRQVGASPVPTPGSELDEYGGMFSQPLAKRGAIKAANKQRRQDKRARKKEIKKVGVENFSIDGYHTGEYNKKGVNIDNPKKRYSRKNPPPLNQGTKYNYKKGDLMDETDHEENEYKSTNEGKIKGTRYNTENVSDIQEDNKGQFMTTLGDNESYDPDSPRPTSSRVTSYDQGRNAVRDTLRPAKGKQFVSSWKLNK